MEKMRQYSSLKRRILIVDDELVNREILCNILRDIYEVDCVDNAKEALDRLSHQGAAYSLVLLDLLMPVMDGFEFLNHRNDDERLKRIPVIVMTSEKESEVRSLELGAADFIKKPYDMPEVIIARCRRIIELFEDKNLISHTERDSISGLYTRDYFFEYIRQIELWSSDIPRDALVFDVEQFHLVNEFCGRPFGDHLLAKIGETMRKELSPMNAIACRADADTFYIFSAHQDDYTALQEALGKVISEFFKMSNVRIRYGLWENVSRDVEIEAWFDRAKTACNSNRGDFTQAFARYDNELHSRRVYEETLIRDLQEAIDHHDLKVYYQPKYNITGDVPRLASAEALVRWIHPKLGFISPGDFIPLFESNGLIQKVDNFVWTEVAIQIRKWKEQYGAILPVSVNVSRIDILDPELEPKLKRIMDVNGLSPADYLLEVTESAYSENMSRLIDVVENLRKLGFRIELDDFGTGYSSLNMITTLPIDILKIDMSFIRNMEKDERNLKLVELVTDIAKFMKIPAVAEGVESQSQLDILKKMGCDIIQGYYFSKPVPPEEFVPFIEKELEYRRNEP
ncbi:EAL domain-containing protein [uncultured Fibrobacter sp.]|uniref:putative bifunctional diguanylate cyclase/phosphodiesterase n=1 Tax=uncultured Fibrobacter sp. TaxID=261512 RepID=UPI0026386612|nr:EAL domain-containing protein [uncultured Fibrobacter sp.]